MSYGFVRPDAGPPPIGLANMSTPRPPTFIVLQPSSPPPPPPPRPPTFIVLQPSSSSTYHMGPMWPRGLHGARVASLSLATLQ